MGKKKPSFNDRTRISILASDDAQAARARAHRLTGEELRRVIDTWDVPYTRAAGWLGLTADGLHKQMRGERRISAQTWLLLEHHAKKMELLALEERVHPTTPDGRAKLRAWERKWRGR